LSSWLRDYLYIPLGGNRLGTLKQYRNLILTMLLGGLWHGASYNFVLWGGLHGVALAIHKFFTTLFPTEQAGRWAGPRTIGGWLGTQLFVLVAWVPFRADSFKDTQIFLQALTLQRVDDGLKSAVVPLSLLIVPIAADHLFTYNSLLKRWHWPARPLLVTAVLGLCFALVLPLMQLAVQNFIYFQF
jgi:alginate O-acetyltransferase complex protein AlgI